VGALERDEWLRAAWKVTVAQSLDARSVVFVDEMGTNISLSPVYGWSRKGERAYCSVPRNRGKNTTLLASMSVQGMGSSLAVEGATTEPRSSRRTWSGSLRPLCVKVRLW
jgi:hypothetical protein